MKCENIHYHKRYTRTLFGFGLKMKPYGPAMCLIKTASNFSREELNTLLNDKLELKVDIEDVTCNFINNKELKKRKCPCLNAPWNDIKNPLLSEARDKINANPIKPKTIYYDKNIHGKGQEYFCRILYGKKAVAYLIETRKITTSKATELGGEIKIYFFNTIEEKDDFLKKIYKGPNHGITDCHLATNDEVEFIEKYEL